MRLSVRDQEIIRTVTRYRQVTAAQIRRLHFPDGSEASRGSKQRRTLARLVKWGTLIRMPRPAGGYLGGSEGFIYLPTTSTARIPDPHTLDITELFVRLVEALREPRELRAGEWVPLFRSDGTANQGLVGPESNSLLAFDPEPYCHTQVGHLELKPDSYIRLKTERGTFQCWLELDRGTEWRTQVSAKMRRYVQAYRKWPDANYPMVVFVVQDAQRGRFIEELVRRQEMPKLFEIRLMDEFTNWLMKP